MRQLTTYWRNGGALIQDMRLGEFDENGKPTFDWMHEVFGIANIEWKNRNGVFLIDGKVYRLKPSKRLYTNYASMAPRPGYKVLAREPLQRENHGLMVRGERTLAPRHFVWKPTSTIVPGSRAVWGCGQGAPAACPHVHTAFAWTVTGDRRERWS